MKDAGDMFISFGTTKKVDLKTEKKFQKLLPVKIIDPEDEDDSDILVVTDVNTLIMYFEELNHEIKLDEINFLDKDNNKIIFKDGFMISNFFFSIE
ncbi:hypothetical protein AZO1586I_579 [Bathymodiolus thermophilus thioautotrophic gill symbiont]|jgi:hypothetical protein|uniref:Uncharacterized protein n=2 Tax=sulfur-oxidizing symbionts TaxID=32036 RepID=A0ACA8ZNR0_9GAMM|nr:MULTISPECIES: hypothetical protein [sulfur-oxidizing symbionts]CAB5497535.1 hypothetical protein AZO1586R_615 [Bathymodiolus azoricus thioautotrophic gill symbiont]CAB5499970.1 hypothetical protein AZO1586I_579 [Bathymodiolus thermophilus thioautotrophic gill symbiont]CAC9510853.1 hypothetical protein [uncultured Gammaproteobacteria bacterium]